MRPLSDGIPARRFRIVTIAMIGLTIAWLFVSSGRFQDGWTSAGAQV